MNEYEIVYGQIVALQVEISRDGQFALVRLAPDHPLNQDEEPIYFKLDMSVNANPAIKAQIDLLRDALEAEKPVRIMYLEMDEGAHQLVAIRMHR